MANRQDDPSPGLKKQRLDSQVHVQAFDIVDVDEVGDYDNSDAKSGLIQFTLTD